MHAAENGRQQKEMLVEASMSTRSEAVFFNSGKLAQTDQTQGQVF